MTQLEKLPTIKVHFQISLYHCNIRMFVINNTAENGTSSLFCVRNCSQDNFNSCTKVCIEDKDLCDGTIDIYNNDILTNM